MAVAFSGGRKARKKPGASGGDLEGLLVFTPTSEIPAPFVRKHERPRRHDLLVGRPRNGGVASARPSSLVFVAALRRFVESTIGTFHS